ncbi:SUMO-activating enzyme subunit uba-2 [Nannizzia gypsea CBS 118893]|uniref:Ubiquitin-activating enzyme E1-like n=1 Tax=Arthroderma gypseum (strain ATCC MYA-4604 / CBS 118893) TaxID=535722 RepID=E5R2C8_ARTGP|nr:SUMO-activating enzyme subunit uba-2 [Nannizzia gypsea CBS 118893]EFQ97018.1 SUMO-activating enzyme subunit uba-2 [Nannizzia gypsea CBS 118893]
MSPHAAHGRDRFLKQSIGSLVPKVNESRVLLVGAGGIGCELLKNLLLSGFGTIHIIDLDTIDLSNLNRQFLFRHEHIKKPKALVAKEVAQKFRPQSTIEAYHANIKETRFNVDWFASFDLVFNALDNLDARRHVNRMCLAANVPLIESGTTGFNGQVQVIKKGRTECYDCTNKPVPKSFPVCTIRSTPSQPIHCIVWAKSYLFPELFGTSEDDVELDHSEDAENAGEIENLRQEAKALKEIRNSMPSDEFTEKVFEKVFHKDIARLQAVEEMWKSRPMPNPLSYSSLLDESKEIDPCICSDDQKVWTVAQNFVVFKDSILRLKKRLLDAQAETHDGEKSILSFDKDDVDTLDFVASSSNLRAAIFGLEAKSKFDIKQMAGNIIPAIATTNAMTAALCVLQAFKVLKDDYDNAKMVFLERSGARAINTDSLKPPNPDCAVCAVAQRKIFINPEIATLNDLVEKVLRLELGYGEELSVSNQIGTIYDPDLEDNLSKKLSELGVEKDSFITVVDEEDENPRVNLEILVSERTDDTSPISLEASDADIPRKPKPAGEQQPATEIQENGASGKLKRTADEAGLEVVEGQPSKKISNGTADCDNTSTNPIILEDETGTILIDAD